VLANLSKKWALRLVSFSGHDEEIVAYGMEIVVSAAINLTALMVVSFMLGKSSEMLMYIVAFALLRMGGAGGYHAKNHIICLVQYAAASLGAIYTTKCLTCAPIFALIIIAISFTLVFKYAPVETPNRPISSNERSIFKKRSRAMVSALGAAAAILWITGQREYAFICSLAIFIESCSLLPVFNKRGGELA
jgi:accessory gene regulator B